ncbi:MAG: hypothetical protein AAF541_04310 [Pseudomonadota bacterium]
MRGFTFSGVWLCTVLFTGQALADMPGVENPNRAKFNYMLNCQGCHGPSGSGTADGAVPQMQNYVGYFAGVKGGREFLVQVPGSANADLSNSALAEVLNWMLFTLSANELPADFKPYETAEIQRLRDQPIEDVEPVREVLVERINTRLERH